MILLEWDMIQLGFSRHSATARKAMGGAASAERTGKAAGVKKNIGRVANEGGCGKPEFHCPRAYMPDVQEAIPHGGNGQVSLWQVSQIVFVCPDKETLARHFSEFLPQSLCGLLLQSSR